MKKGLFALALGTFTLGMTEFIIEGIITDVAHNMSVSIPEAGHLISIYALGVCAGAFSLILMHKYRPKKILMFLASIITIGAIIASVAPTYWLLLCARFIQGLPHAAYFGTATIVAVKMAKEGKESCVQLASTFCQLHIARYHDDVYDSQMGSGRGCVAE